MTYNQLSILTPIEVFNYFFPNKPLPEWAENQSLYLDTNKFKQGEIISEKVILSKIVGSTHWSYCNYKFSRTWLEALHNLQDLHTFSPDKLDVINTSSGVTLYKVVEDDLYYILDGNHRVTLLKFKGDETHYFNRIITLY